MGKMNEVANEKEATSARVQRECDVREATASVALEGFNVTAEVKRDLEAYVRGDMTLEEALARNHARNVRHAA